MRIGFGVVLGAAATLMGGAAAQTFTGTGSGARAFEQLDDVLPTPNVYRAATGEPGPAYWQQQADYDIKVTLDEDAKRIDATQTITYTNNSPHTLRYVWVALDQNRFKPDSIERLTQVTSTSGARWSGRGAGDRLSFGHYVRESAFDSARHGFEIKGITARGRDLPFTVVDSHLRIDLPQPLESGRSTSFTIDFGVNILNRDELSARNGYECFPYLEAEKTGDCIYFLSQWFPRMTAFTDYEGWHNKAFLGRGEFTLEFGDYDVEITVPADHIVAASGVLQNANDVLTPAQIQRLDQAEDASSPVFVVTPDEAKENEKEQASDTVTWKFRAENVRDFAWSSSRKYIWDAQGFKQDDEEHPLVMAMSFYPNEAEPIWSQYSTEAIIHTMEVYNKFAFNYPYPTAQSVNTWERGGMEYPMITFNGYRPNTKDAPDGEITYSRGIKYGLIGVIIHEIGHIYFPMVVNSDERQWTWMDEGINTFLEYVAEYEWEEDFPILGGKPNPLDVITTYMTSSNQVPIMTQSDSILQIGPNAYSKPASALLILRETVLGRELFDAAFREYSRRWKFKRPTPSDFFRSMEETSGVDLDWFFRGWFYTTDHVDLAVTGVREYRISTQDPDIEAPLERAEDADRFPQPIAEIRNREEGLETRLSQRENLRDFYTENDRFEQTNKDRNDFKKFLDGLSSRERLIYDEATTRNPYVYYVDFANLGGLVMPIPLTFTFADGTTEDMMIPAEIWRYDAENVSKMFIRDKQIVSVEIDRRHEIADADKTNNALPQKIVSSRFDLYKSSPSRNNQMADSLVKLDGEEKEPADTSAEMPLTDEVAPPATPDQGQATGGDR